MGKTNLILNAAVAAAGLGRRVLLVDGDLGLANVDVLLGVVPRWDIGDIIDGRCRVDEALITGPSGLSILPAASGRADLAAARVSEMSALLASILADSWTFDLVLVDAGSGIGASVRALASCCERAVFVTTPEQTSITDVYATLKVVHRDAPTLRSSLLVNQVVGAYQGHDVAVRLQRAAQRFIGTEISLEQEVPFDHHVAEAVECQVPWVTRFPNAPASRAITRLAARWAKHSSGVSRHDSIVPARQGVTS